MYRCILIVFIIAILFQPARPIQAQTEDLPIYVVQPGDTINLIAMRFNVSSSDLIAANDLPNPDILAVGTQLKIPGLYGISGELTTQVISLGENLSRLSHFQDISPELIIKVNRITSPNEVYAGSTLIVPVKTSDMLRSEMLSLSQGQSMLEYALINNINQWETTFTNQKKNPASLLPGESFFSTKNSQASYYWGSSLVKDIQVLPLPLVQGKTITLRILTSEAAIAGGELDGKPLNFFSSGENEYVALQGIRALAEPGLTNLKLEISSPNMDTFTIEQPLLLEPGYYPNDPPLYVDPQTIDKSITDPEDDLIRSIISQISPEKKWAGIFQLPVDEPACIKSWYGNRRSYNDSPFTYFHTGVDYGVCSNLNIYSPADGIVVYTGQLTVRGNATIIDHGWGVFSGIWHQKSINVEVGDHVTMGQLIGEIGGTGRATGPHLHWEVWVNGVQVQPLDWLDIEFPNNL